MTLYRATNSYTIFCSLSIAVMWSLGLAFGQSFQPQIAHMQSYTLCRHYIILDCNFEHIIMLCCNINYIEHCN